MKRKATKSRAGKPKRAPSRSSPQAAVAKQKAAPTKQHDVDAMVAACAPALGLTIDPAWQENVKFNLRLILRHAALVEEFPLSDEAEPAPIFHA
jgi:Protein of unknown function (DUF4089)